MIQRDATGTQPGRRQPERLPPALPNQLFLVPACAVKITFARGRHQLALGPERHGRGTSTRRRRRRIMTMMISVVIPCFNEEAVLFGELFERMTAAAEAWGDGLRIYLY